jgi:hypothetical protein
MWTRDTHKFAGKPGDLVAAVFFDQKTARDAIADLQLAGFHADHIAVAVPEYRKSEPPISGRGEHTVRWKLRHSFEHDLQSHGAGLSAKKELEAATLEDPPYTEIDLVENLSDLGVARDTIRLLEDRMGAKGLIVIVHAKERIDKAESILVKNRGMLRTPMVTQPSSTMLRS